MESDGVSCTVMQCTVMRVHESLWGYIYPLGYMYPWEYMYPRGYMYPWGYMYPRGYMYPQGYMYLQGYICPHRLSCTLMTVHPSASQCMRLHQTPSDSHPPAKVGDRWKTFKVDLRRYRGQFWGGLSE